MALPATVRTSLDRFLTASHEADKALHDLLSAVQAMLKNGGITNIKLRPHRGKPSRRGQPRASTRIRTLH